LGPVERRIPEIAAQGLLKPAEVAEEDRPIKPHLLRQQRQLFRRRVGPQDLPSDLAGRELVYAEDEKRHHKYGDQEPTKPCGEKSKHPLRRLPCPAPLAGAFTGLYQNRPGAWGSISPCAREERQLPISLSLCLEPPLLAEEVAG